MVAHVQVLYIDAIIVVMLAAIATNATIMGSALQAVACGAAAMTESKLNVSGL